MPTLTELIKESLEGKLSDQILASLEADGNEMNEAAGDHKLWFLPDSTFKQSPKSGKTTYPLYELDPAIRKLSKKLNADDLYWTYFPVISKADKNFTKIDKALRDFCELKQATGSIEVWQNPLEYGRCHFYNRNTHEWVLVNYCLTIPTKFASQLSGVGKII